MDLKRVAGIPLVIACCLLSLNLRASADEGKTCILAVIPSNRGVYQPSGEVVAELEMALFKEPEFVLVERQQISRIFSEHALAQSSLGQLSDRLKMGSWINADAILFIDGDTKDPRSPTQLSVVEAATGVTLSSKIIERQSLLDDMPAMLKWIKTSADRRLVPLTNRRLVGMLELHNEEAGTYLDTTISGLSSLLRTGLAEVQDISMLDREHVEYLRLEKNLSSVDAELRSSVLLVNGGVRRAANKDELAITLKLSPLSGAGETSANLVVPATNAVAARTLMIKTVAGMLKRQDVPLTPTDSKAESLMFARQSRLWSKWGNSEKALTAASAAYALQPCQSNRIWLGECTLRPGRSLDEAIDGFGLYEEYLDTKVREMTEGIDKDPIIPLPLWDQSSLPLGMMQLHESYREDDSLKRKKRIELMELEERFWRKVLAHYRQHFKELNFRGRNIYWVTWSKVTKRLPFEWYPWSMQKQVDFVREIMAAFADGDGAGGPMSPERMDSIFLLELVPRTPEDQKLVSQLLAELQHHKDPLIRVAAEQMILRGIHGPLTAEDRQLQRDCSRRAWEIAVNEVTAGHPYRRDPDVERHLLRWGLPALDAQQMKEFGADCYLKIVDECLATQQFSHLQSLKEVLPEWLDQLEAAGRIAEADKLAQRTLERVAAAKPEERRGYLIPEMTQKLRDQRHKYAVALNVPVAEKSNDGAWDEFQIDERDFKLGFEERAPVVLFAVGGELQCLYHWGDAARSFNYRLCSYQLPECTPKGTIKLLMPATPFDGPSMARINAVCGNSVYVSTGDGLAVFSLNDGKASTLQEKEGLPGKRVSRISSLDGKLYLAFKDKSHLLASFDPATGKTTILASQSAAEKKNPLDGQNVEYMGLAGDSLRKCLWISGTIWIPTGPSSSKGESHFWRFDAAREQYEERADLQNCFRAPTRSDLGAALDGRYLFQFPDLVEIESKRKVVSFPWRDPDAGQFDCNGLVMWEGAVPMLSGRFGSNGVVCLFDAAGGRLLPLRQVAGRPMPSVNCMQKTKAGVIVSCDDGSGYLIRLRHEQWNQPIPQ